MSWTPEGVGVAVLEIPEPAPIASTEVGLHELGESIASTVDRVQTELARYPSSMGAYVLDEIDLDIPVDLRVDELGQVRTKVIDSAAAANGGVGKLHMRVRPVLGASQRLADVSDQPLSVLVELTPAAIGKLEGERIYSVEDLARAARSAASRAALEALELGVELAPLLGKAALLALPVVRGPSARRWSRWESPIRTPSPRTRTLRPWRRSWPSSSASRSPGTTWRRGKNARASCSPCRFRRTKRSEGGAMATDGDFPLGRLEPSDWKHVEKYPYSAVAPRSADTVEKALPLPRYRTIYDQQREGACVGFASSWMVSILNRRLYNARWLWNRAKAIDEYPQTNPGDNSGTSVRAAMDVLRDEGHIRVVHGQDRPISPDEGVAENRWARTVDEIRTSIAGRTPVVFGTDWYTNFDKPVRKGRDWFVGDGISGASEAGTPCASIAPPTADRRSGSSTTGALATRSSGCRTTLSSGCWVSVPRRLSSPIVRPERVRRPFGARM